MKNIDDVIGRKIKATTTLELLRENHACKPGYKKLLKYLGEGYPKNKEINLLTILDSNGVADMLWCLRATVRHIDVNVMSLMAADFAESVLHIYESQHPENKSVRECIDTARSFVTGEATIDEFLVSRRAAAYVDCSYAAYAAIYAADAAADAANSAYVDCSYAASAAAYAAAYAAYAAASAAYVAYVAADDAADDAAAGAAAGAARTDEREKQDAIIKKYLKR